MRVTKEQIESGFVRPFAHAPLRGKIVHDYAFGTTKEPYATAWLQVLADAAGMREGIRVLDIGCGNGRMAAFLAGHLADFLYLGTEPDNRFGFAALSRARRLYRDRRVLFAHCRSTEENAFRDIADAVILGSVFTHIPIEESLAMLEFVRPVAERGGRIVFTAILGPFYRCEGKAYGDGYAIVENMASQYAGALAGLPVTTMEFDTRPLQPIHTVYSVGGTK